MDGDMSGTTEAFAQRRRVALGVNEMNPAGTEMFDRRGRPSQIADV